MFMSYEVAEALIEVKGVGFKPNAPITFKSGMKSPVYCDNRTFPFWPEQWAKVIRGFEKLIADDRIEFDVIGGIEAAGIPHSAALGFAMAKPSIFIRKETKDHGMKRRVEGGDVLGKRVVLLEDLVTTGGSSLSGVEALRAEGAIVTDCLAIISYNFPEAAERFEAAGVKLHALTTFDVVLDIALSRSMIDEAGAASVRQWLSDPHGWAKRVGLDG
jgi:orotate phosphoribosyltransferase